MNLPSEIIRMILSDITSFDDIISFSVTNKLMNSIVNEYIKENIKYINKDNIHMIVFKDACKMKLIKKGSIYTINIKNNVYHGVYNRRSYDNDKLTIQRCSIYDNGRLVQANYYYVLKDKTVIDIHTHGNQIIITFDKQVYIDDVSILNNTNFKSIVYEWGDQFQAGVYIKNTSFAHELDDLVTDDFIKIYKDNLN